MMYRIYIELAIKGAVEPLLGGIIKVLPIAW